MGFWGNLKDDNLIISDSAADSLGCWPAKPPGFGDKPLFKLGDITDQYVILTLFKIKREIVTERKRKLLDLELHQVMTGFEQTDVIKEKRQQTVLKTNNKRKLSNKKRKTKGCLSLNKSRN